MRGGVGQHSGISGWLWNALQMWDSRQRSSPHASVSNCQSLSHCWILPCEVRDVEPQNKAGFPPLTLIIKKKKEQKACCLLIAPLCRPCRVGSKADCRLLTVVATAIFQTAICNWLINAAWVQTVMLIKLRRGFRKQYWWVLQGARRGWTCMSFPSRNSENKQTSKV